MILFIFNLKSRFAIVVLYDDMNLNETPKKFQKIVDYLKREFKMKDLEKIGYCLRTLVL